MPSVIDQHLIDNATPLQPNGRVQSHVIDVRGAQYVAVNVSIVSNDPNVWRTIYFGPTTNNAFTPLRRDNFGSNNNMSTFAPVCGPKLMVIVENFGTQQTTCDGTVYAVRQVP
jgi:hypothetical protein